MQHEQVITPSHSCAAAALRELSGIANAQLKLSVSLLGRVSAICAQSNASIAMVESLIGTAAASRHDPHADASLYGVVRFLRSLAAALAPRARESAELARLEEKLYYMADFAKRNCNIAQQYHQSLLKLRGAAPS